MNILAKLAAFTQAVLISWHFLAPLPVPAPSPSPVLSATAPSTPALIDTYLASSIAKTDTSLTLANGSTTAGTSLSGTICFTLDVNTPTVEYVCGTAAGISISSLSRGIDPLNPNTTSSALAFSHRRFASVQVSDYPTIQFLVRSVNGTDAVGGVLSYPAGTTNAQVSASGQNLVNYNTLASTSIAGAVNSDFTHTGLVQLATKLDLASSTATGTTGAYLVPANSFYSPTSTATTTIPVTNGSGTLDTNFIRQTASSTYNFLGQTTLASTTLSATTTVTKNLFTASLGYGVLIGGGSSTPVSSVATTTVGNYLVASGTGWISSPLSGLFGATSSAASAATTTAATDLLITCHFQSTSGGNVANSINLDMDTPAGTHNVMFGNTGCGASCAQSDFYATMPVRKGATYWIGSSLGNCGAQIIGS